MSRSAKAVVLLMVAKANGRMRFSVPRPVTALDARGRYGGGLWKMRRGCERCMPRSSGRSPRNHTQPRTRPHAPPFIQNTTCWRSPAVSGIFVKRLKRLEGGAVEAHGIWDSSNWSIFGQTLFAAIDRNSGGVDAGPMAVSQGRALLRRDRHSNSPIWALLLAPRCGSRKTARRRASQ
jgi:hypothetical protein